MSVLAIGDLHLKASVVLPAVALLAGRLDAPVSRVVVLGDLMDDWNASPTLARQETETLTSWVRRQRAAGVTAG